ncbi:Hsp70 family protein, partial [Bacillus safensis]|uniref:Hsp70 family protein n=1 Tax=Bacillus safensis TaxID=561879 RepID=UPI00227DE920
LEEKEIQRRERQYDSEVKKKADADRYAVEQSAAAEKAKRLAEADAKKKEEIEVRNEADQLVFTTEKTLKDLEGKIDEEQVKKANDAKDALKAAIEKGEFEDIKAKKDELQTIVQELTTKLYEEAAKQAQAQQEGAEGAQKADDNVVDAEYEEVNDDQEKK